MKSLAATLCVSLALLTSCASDGSITPDGGSDSLANPNTPTASSGNTGKTSRAPGGYSEVIASVGDINVTRQMLEQPLIEAYGMQFSMHLLQLELARGMAKQAGVTVTPADIEREKQLMMDSVFKDNVPAENFRGSPAEKAEYVKKERQRLLDQFLATQRLTVPEFNMAMETGANLRGAAQVQLKDAVTDEKLQDAFRIEYGEKVRVRHIEVANAREAAEARRRMIEEKKSFADVAGEMSINRKSAAGGGELRAFSRSELGWPRAFVDTAFALRNPGDISDPVQTESTVHLIQLIAKIPPSAVKFEDHKEALRQKLMVLMVQVQIKAMRDTITRALQTVHFHDAALRGQYGEKVLERGGGAPADSDQVRKAMEIERNGKSTTKPGDLRPPATRPVKGQ